MPSTPFRARATLAPFALAVLITLPTSACRDLSDQAAPGEAKLVAPDAPAAADLAGRGSAGAPSRALTQVVATSASVAPQRPAPQPPSGMLIRNGDVGIQVDSLQKAIELVRQVAASVGGYIGSVAMFTGEHQVHSASLELKVPAARFDDAMAGVRPIGEVERSNATAQDVGEEFVDLSARIANSRRLEERLIRLLATRTGKLDDVLAVERELARVREEIERQEGRIRFLSAHVAMSTITVTVHEKPPLVATEPGTHVMRDAFVGMWRNMVAVVASGIQALGLVIPPLVIAMLAWLGWRRLRRRQAPALNVEPSV